MTIKNILVPVDFSPPSRVALNHGIAFARKCRARLTMVNVVETAIESFGFPVRLDRPANDHQEQARRMLSALVSPEDEDDRDIQFIVKQGDVDTEIVSSIREQQADMVVMGTHGRGLVGRTLIGSVTQHMLRKLPIPILTVCHVTRPPAFERILFATDLSDSSSPGFRALLEIAGMMRSQVTLLHTIDTARLRQTAEAIVDIDISAIRNDARSRLNALAAAAVPNVKTETLVVEGHPSSAILKGAEDNSSDLIAITVGEKGLFERTLLGSTAEHVIRDARIPVLAFPVA